MDKPYSLTTISSVTTKYSRAALPLFGTGEAQILVQSERKGEEKEDFNRCGF